MVAGLVELLSVPRPPAFLCLHHPHHTSCADIDLTSLHRCQAVRVDAIECHTPRLLYSTILDRFRFALGVEGKEEAAREITTWDELSRGMRTAWQDSMRSRAGPSNRKSTASTRAPKGKGKGVEPQIDAKLEETDDHVALIVTHAERLSRVLGYLWSGLTRMKELVSRRFAGPREGDNLTLIRSAFQSRWCCARRCHGTSCGRSERMRLNPSMSTAHHHRSRVSQPKTMP